MTQKPFYAQDVYTGAQPLQRLLTYRLSRVLAKLNAQSSRILKARADLSLTQWRIVMLVAAKGRTTLSEISRKAALDKGLVSRNLKPLANRGLIVIEPDSVDQRQHYLTLSKKGREIYDRTSPTMQARQEFLLTRLSQAERKAIFSALDKLEIAAEEGGFES